MACITTKKYKDKETGQVREAIIIDFYDQTGKRRLETLEPGTTKKKAKDRLREIEEQVDKKVFLPAKKIPLFKEVVREWIEYKKAYLRANTWDVYNGHVRKHFHSDEELKTTVDLDSMRIDRITVATVEKFIRDKQDSGMHLQTLRKSLVILGQIFNYAVRHRYIQFNPLREAERPRSQGHEGEAEDKEIKVLTPAQIKTLIEKVEEQEFRMLFMLAVFTGMRQGEILGLKWEDILWESKQVHVKRTFNNGRFFETKTKGSNRKIDLAPTVMTELKKWKLAAGKNDLGLIFTNDVGKVNGKVEGKIRFHDLRHSYASILIEQGENLKYIQTQLGHASPTVTLNVYAHLMKPANPEAALRLETRIFGNGDFLETSEKSEARNA